VIAGHFNDRLTGDAVANLLEGSGGDDTLSGGGGNDTLVGGAGSDHVVFLLTPDSGGVDRINDFLPANDKLVFDNATFSALGTAGNFGAGDARFAAGAGFTSGQDVSDRLIYNTTNGNLYYDPDGSGGGASQLVATFAGNPGLAATDISIQGAGGGGDGGTPGGDSVVGTEGHDSLTGTVGNDTLTGLGGNDTLNGGDGGTDFYDGGTGFDTIDLRAPVTGITVNFAAGSIEGARTGSFTAVERLLAGNGNDHLVGAAGGQNLSGRSGNDTLAGAAGVDTLWGGAGADQFIFAENGNANADLLYDFTSGSDKVVADNSAMAALGAEGNFATGDSRFRAGAGITTGQDGDDRLIYNTSTGSLYYDADGSGSGGSLLVVTLQGNLTFAASDITIV
jgi:serralysin